MGEETIRTDNKLWQVRDLGFSKSTPCDNKLNVILKSKFVSMLKLKPKNSKMQRWYNHCSICILKQYLTNKFQKRYILKMSSKKSIIKTLLEGRTSSYLYIYFVSNFLLLVGIQKEVCEILVGIIISVEDTQEES